jgi:alkanesulfonate monooxygenase SsuD/methylene tetrahydromethanopterin reductase-like flavin-dependent oxidoreductase (luciferase family)
MSDIATPVNLGMIGVHYVEGELTPQAAATVARLGYTAVWIAGTREAPHHRGAGARGDRDARRGHRRRECLVRRSASRRGHLPPARGGLPQAYPGRFLLGIGAGHRELGTDFRSPYQALVDYLDVLD